MTVFYDWSGGMESSAMLVLDRERIRETGAIVRWADTGKHFPEMYESKRQIESLLGLTFEVIKAGFSFDDWLFGIGPKGGKRALRRGWNECSKNMKRRPIMAHCEQYPKPWEINLGFNAGEQDRADDFTDRNERDYCHWRFPLIEHNVSRNKTWWICGQAGFSILTGMYKKMGRFDCFWCPNQTPGQARKVIKHYPELAAEWMRAEDRKGHSFLRTPLRLIEKDMNDPGLFSGCSCFGGTDDVWEEDEATPIPRAT